MTNRTLVFRFDYISPYAYLAWKTVHALAERNACEVVPVPILFAALLNAFGHKGPAEIPPKRLYTFKHVVRIAHALKVPFAPPPAHRVAKIADDAGLDGKAAVKEANETATKDRVRGETDRAIALGIFGVPTITVDDESFWGVDSLPHLEAYLQGKDPATLELLARWRDLPVGASRVVPK